MARTVSLATLVTDVQTKGDFGGATVRHTPAQIKRLINQSIQLFRERISDEGSTHYLVSSSGTLGVGPTSPYPFYQLDLSGLSPGLVRTYGIDVTFPGGDVRTLDHVPFDQRAKYGTAIQGGAPQAWAHFRRDQVAILPAPSTAYAYTVWYLPVLADLSADGDTFDGVAGWEDFVVWDVVCQLIARDQFPQAFAIAESRRATVWENIIRSATKVTQAGGAHLGRDSFGGKLPLFLGGRRPVKVAAGGPVTPASGSVTNAMLADMTGPTVKAVMSGTTRPQDVQVATLTTYLGLFNTTQRGLVPPPISTTNLFLRDDGTWASAAGAGSAAGASGAVQFQGGAGSFGNASGFAVIGTHPSLIARLDGSMRVTGGQVEVGSGTTRIQSTGIDLGQGSIVNVATLVTAALQAPAFTDTTAGLAPASGGGTTNFLRADGAWQAPPGGAGSAAGGSGAIQYSDGAGGFVGQTLLSIQQLPASFVPRPAISFGDPNVTAGFTTGDLRTASGFVLAGNTPSGGRAFPFSWNAPATEATGGSVVFGSVSSVAINNSLRSIGHEIATGGVAYWRFGNATGPTIRGTGASFNQHLHANSLTLATGLGLDQLQPVGSGMFLGNLSGTGTPSPVAVATMHAFAPTFTSTKPGTVPESGGGTDNYLRADGSWSIPPGGSSTQPSGIAGSVQFRGAAGFEGATGITVVASGMALAFGTGAPEFGGLRFGNGYEVTWAHPHGFGIAGIGVAPDGVVNVGAASGTELDLHSSSVVDMNIAGVPLVHRWSRIAYNMASGTTITNAQSVKLDALAASGTVDLSTSSTLRAQVSASGLQLFDGLNFPTGVPRFGHLALGSGITNALMAPMGSGTVKGNLTGTGAPSDVSIPTLFAFSPTFTSTQMGDVPASGGGTTNYLRADGTWSTPPGQAGSPGGGLGALQYHDGVGFGGATGVNITASGQALAFGVPSFHPGFGDIRVASGFNITANLPSGVGGVAATQRLLDWSGGGASGVLKVGGASGILGTHRSEVATGGAFEWLIGGQTGMALKPTGLDAPGLHVNAKSLSIGHINGLPFDFNGLKRGLDIGNSSGLPSGLSLYLPRGAGSGANRYIIPSGAVGTGTQANPRFVTLSPTGGRGGAVIRIEKVNDGGWPFEIRTPTGTVLHSFPSGAKGWADCMFEKPSGAVFQLAGHADMF